MSAVKPTHLRDRIRAGGSLLVATCLIVGCQAPAATKKPEQKPALDGKQVAGSPRPGSTPGLGTQLPAGVLSNQGATLIGRIRGPAHLVARAGLISDRGTGIVTDRGAAIVTDRGAALKPAGGLARPVFGLHAAVEQRPVAGVEVILRDAAGKPIVGASGPLVAVTAADGSFRLALPAKLGNAVLTADLGADNGVLQAVVPKAEAGERTVDVDLVSTLTTGYILDRFVKGQAQPQVVLDALPSDVEARTRGAAASALEAAPGEAVPKTLSIADVVGSVERLRKTSPALDGELEVVRKLLIAAGQSDLGSGLRAAEVDVGPLTLLAPGSDGSLWFVASQRVWRLGQDERVEALLGSTGTTPDAAPDGKPGREVALGAIRRLAVDRAGRPVVVDMVGGKARILRLEADGRVKTLLAPDAWPGGPSPYGEPIAIGEGDRVLLLARGRSAQDAPAIWAVEPGRAPAPYRALTTRDAEALDLDVVAAGPDGRVRLLGYDDKVYVLDAATGQLAVEVDGAGAARVVLDPSGSTLVLAADRRTLTVHRPGAAAQKVTSQFPEADTLAVDAAAVMGDGTVYYAESRDRQLSRRLSRRHLYRLRDGAVSQVLGPRAAAPTSAAAAVVPASVVVADDGALILAEPTNGRLVRVDAEQRLQVLAGGEGATDTGDGVPATRAALPRTDLVRRDAKGDLYLMVEPNSGRGRIRRVDAAGDITTFWQDPAPRPGFELADFVITPGGTLYVACRYEGSGAGGPVRKSVVLRIAPGAQPVEILNEPDQLTLRPQRLFLALAPTGTLYVVGGGKLRSWTAASGLRTLREDPVFSFSGRHAQPGSDLAHPYSGLVACDAQGRIYMAQAGNGVDEADPAKLHAILRFDPATGVRVAIAGAGTPRFGGSGVDDGLLFPAGLSFDRAGDLFFADVGHRQIKRIPAEDLP